MGGPGRGRVCVRNRPRVRPTVSNSYRMNTVALAPHLSLSRLWLRLLAALIIRYVWHLVFDVRADHATPPLQPLLRHFATKSVRDSALSCRFRHSCNAGDGAYSSITRRSRCMVAQKLNERLRRPPSAPVNSGVINAWLDSLTGRKHPQDGLSALWFPALQWASTLFCAEILSTAARLNGAGCNPASAQSVIVLCREIPPGRSLWPIGQIVCAASGSCRDMNCV